MIPIIFRYTVKNYYEAKIKTDSLREIISAHLFLTHRDFRSYVQTYTHYIYMLPSISPTSFAPGHHPPFSPSPFGTDLASMPWFQCFLSCYYKSQNQGLRLGHVHFISFSFFNFFHNLIKYIFITKDKHIQSKDIYGIVGVGLVGFFLYIILKFKNLLK